MRQQPPGSTPECDPRTCSEWEHKHVRYATREVSCLVGRIVIRHSAPNMVCRSRRSMVLARLLPCPFCTRQGISHGEPLLSANCTPPFSSYTLTAPHCHIHAHTIHRVSPVMRKSAILTPLSSLNAWNICTPSSTSLPVTQHQLACPTSTNAAHQRFILRPSIAALGHAFAVRDWNHHRPCQDS